MFTLVKHKGSKDTEMNKWERWFQLDYCLKTFTAASVHSYVTHPCDEFCHANYVTNRRN